MNRNEFIDIDTGEDVYEKLLGKRITVTEKLKELREFKWWDINNKKFSELNEEVDVDWDITGIWYADGLTYLLALGKEFKRYLFEKSKARYIYEVIPTLDTNIFEMYMYLHSENMDEFVSFSDCFKYFDGINGDYTPENFNKTDYSYQIKKFGKIIHDNRQKYEGVFWRLKPGFKLNLLYKCVKTECLDKAKDIWKFYLKKNEKLTNNITFSLNK